MAHVYKYKDEELRLSKETYDKLKALPVEDRRNALERGYNALKVRKQESARQEELDQRSEEAKKVLFRFDPTVKQSGSAGMSIGLAPTTQKTFIPGLGEGPKEPYIAAALKIPEQDLDTTSGLPAGIRSKVSLLADREARRVFLEKQTGGTLESLNINGRTEDYIRFPNGKVVQVDETGFSAKDFSDMSGEILPTSAEVFTSLGLSGLSIKTGGLSALAAGTAAPAAGALTREFQSIFAQEVLGFAPEIEVDFLESTSRVATDTIIGAVIEVPLTVAARRVVKRFPESREINKVANAAADSTDEYNKKFDTEIKAGKLEALPVVPITKEGLEYQATARPETMIRSIQKTQDNLNSVPEVIFGGPKTAKKVIQESARREIDTLDKATQGITDEIDSLGRQNVQNLTKDLADQKSTIEFSLTGGTQPIDQLAKSAGETSTKIIGKVDSKISGRNKKLYEDVFESAVNEQVSIPVRTVVEAIQGKTIARKGKKKLDPPSVDAVVYELFLKVIQKPGKQFKTLDELKADDFFKNGKVTFAELDKLWKTNKEVFGGSATSKNSASRDLDKRLNDLRKSSVRNAPQTKAALEKADAFYRDIHDFQKRNIKPQFFNGPQSKGANVGLKSLVSNNSLKSAEDIRFAREQIERFGDPEDIRLFNQSLRYQILNEKNFFDGVPGKLGIEEKILFREVFGENEANFLFNFAEAARVAGSELTLENVEKVGNIFLRQGRAAGRKAVDDLIQADKLQKRRDDLASEALFSRSDSMEIINGDLSFAGKRINGNVSPESVSTFVSQLNSTEKRAFKKYTIASLIENQGKMQGQTGLFDAGSVLKTLENNPEKYEIIFGSDVGKVKSYLKVFENYSVDLKKAREAASGQLHYGYRTVLSPDTGQLRLYTNFLLNISSPTRWKGRAASLILASAFTSGKFNPKLSKWTLPDLEYNEAYITKLLQSMLIGENSIDLVLGQDDMVQRMVFESLGLSNMDRPNSSTQAPLQELFED